jgi:hypothetical protein
MRIGNYWLGSRLGKSLGGSDRPLPYQGTLEFPLLYVLCLEVKGLQGFVGLSFEQGERG